MSGILSFLRDAIAPTAEARVGFLAGEDQRRDRDRAEAIQDTELRRQSTLDQLKAAVDQSTIARNGAYADRAERVTPKPEDYDQFDGPDGFVKLRNRHTPGDVRPLLDNNGQPVPVKKPAPPNTAHEIIDNQDMYQRWDPKTQSYVPTGIQARARVTGTGRGGSGAGAQAQERLDATTALKTAEGDMPRPSKVPEADPFIFDVDPKTGKMTRKANPAAQDRSKDPAYEKAVSDSTAYDKNVLEPLRQNVYRVTLGDKVPATGEKLFPKPQEAPPAPAAKGPDTAAAQQEFDAAGAQLQKVLKSPLLSDDQKATARAAYDARLTKIAKKYGMTSGAK